MRKLRPCKFCDLTALMELAYCFMHQKTVDTDRALRYKNKPKYRKIFEDPTLYMKMRSKNRAKAELGLTKKSFPFYMMAAYLQDTRDYYEMLLQKQQDEECKDPTTICKVVYDNLVGLLP